MRASIGSPSVFTIPPSCPFLSTFVDAFLGGSVVQGLHLDADPFAVADVTIYVPTQRSARALADAFAEARGGALLLPRILPLGALDDSETELILGGWEAPADQGLLVPSLPPAATSIWRRLQLTRLIKGWAAAVDGALRKVDADGLIVTDPTEAFRVTTSTVDAFELAGKLADLIDEMLIETVEWRTLDTLAMASFDDYWRITTTFLSIAFERWPAILKDHGRMDAAARQIALLDAQASLIASAAKDRPVIALGSTGTNPATGRLLAAIARASKGAVVLPGLDLDLDENAFAMVGGQLANGQEPCFVHPQAAMARLLPALGIERSAVRELGVADKDLRLRDRFVAEAMRPADTTDTWRAYRHQVGEADLAGCLDGVTLVEAADEREEALCLAIAMREVLETPGRTSALMTPDRELARRVRGELLRWEIEVLDTGGEPLGNRPLGVLARRLATCAASGGAARDLAAVLEHPLATFGRPRKDVARLARLFDIAVLRVVPLADATPDQMFARARSAAGEAHAHPAQRSIAGDDWRALETFWRDVSEVLKPLLAPTGAAGLRQRAAAHRACLSAVAPTPAGDEYDAMAGLFEELQHEDAAELSFDAGGYAIFFGRLCGEVTLRNTARPHPRLAIYGLIEARLLPADVMLLGGLDETIWPPQPSSDPFLNRPMRQNLGLRPPERRLGQTAHDFAMAMGASRVVLSRAAKRGGSPSVPSRFLLRLQALGGSALDGCRTRGAELLALARAIDRAPGPTLPARRPSPRPPVALRPTRLSVTQIETLRRDPYAIFAAHILRIAPLPQLGEDLDASEFGTLMHAALHRFTAHPHALGSSSQRRTTLASLFADTFAAALTDPLFLSFRWPIVTKAMDVFLAFDEVQRRTADTIRAEETGVHDIALADGSTFRLIARADRIDHHRDGSTTLIDYKTGQPPGTNEVQVGFAPQMTLQAAMLRRGAFGEAPSGEIGATYVKLGGRDGGLVRAMAFKTEAFGDVAERHYQGLCRLLSAFRNGNTGYLSRPFPKYARKEGPYDHLARVREWSLAAEEEGQP